ncbi:MAG: malto-oligosyltrehalose synthase [Halomonadaceae bacterium]|uniref:Malto-oligosyltrehalose synthase n=1 Tax=Halomonas colorata TaxID=2742615 RepID=A0ABR9FX22_9GAMM|nr:malto-oligosyltrehalose synthase [Halomonas colorata]MBE0463198.1 malto-oligosyltrehalose synthase [Halomonas colorata]
MNEIRATLRLQFHRDFTLADAERWVDYYAALGISHIYASPLQASRAGSPHGYDGVDPTRIDSELGGEAALKSLVSRLRAHNMGLVLDIVPNHLAVGGSENLWWQDVLAWGGDSPYAGFFDIDWHPDINNADPTLNGKLLVPFLGAAYAEVLNSGELTLDYDAEAASFHVDYHEHRFPIDPRHYGDILRFSEHNALYEQAAFFEALQQDEDAYTSTQDARRQLNKVLESPAAQASLSAVMKLFNGASNNAATRLHALLERQHYRLAWWRTASDEINWRRFFDVTELGGLRIEDPKVFEAVHALPLRLVEEGWVDGLRIDHVDGLADPRGYCLRLRQHLDALEEKRPADAPRNVTLYVEKILGDGETLHTDWGVDGTSGYEFMNEVSGIQHDPASAAPLRQLWHEVSGRNPDFSAEVRLARREILASLLASEFSACARALHAVARAQLSSRDITLAAIRRALEALIVHFPIYRTYADDTGRPDADQPFFTQAMQGARQALNPPDIGVLEALERWLGGEAPSDCAKDNERQLRQRAITRFQQLTSPVAAKAVEDTAGYRSAVLISRNDVGFDGEHFSHSAEHFHQANARRARDFPGSMVTTATHDHKRGEDVRSRLAALSEHVVMFTSQVERWRKIAAPLRQSLPEGLAPSPGDELILYQILLGAWSPTLDPQDDEALEHFNQRLAEWQLKALREAKLRSHWLWPDEAYESACRTFLEGLLSTAPLRDSIVATARTLDLPGAINSLVQTALRLTVPGVPDLYQGSEFWDYSLVDPDNRRPVDYGLRQAGLDQALPPTAALRTWRDGRVKQALIARLLELRHRHPRLFAHGDYHPLMADGERANHVVAFTRRYTGYQLLVVVPRLTANLLDNTDRPHIPQEHWEDTCLQPAPGCWQSVLTEATLEAGSAGISVASLLAELPVGVFLHADHTDSSTEAPPFHQHSELSK